MSNHFEHNYHLGNKKALFYNLWHYYHSQNRLDATPLPLTYHIKDGLNDPAYTEFTNEYERRRRLEATKNMWIVKPGELTNRGCGIMLIRTVGELQKILRSGDRHSSTGELKTYIVQEYIEKPMLYRGRKFDIRHYLLITRLYGRLRAYWFVEGYVRTSSERFNLNDTDAQIHLTNDAVQRCSSSYGKFEEGNKLAYSELDKYL